MSLPADLKPETLPQHVAIIMDGNGRWARKRFLPRSAGHTAGMYKVKSVIRMSSDLGIRYLTLYAFSTENWKRPEAEVGFLMKLLIEFLNQELDEMHRRNVVFRTIGDVTALPDPVQKVLCGAEEKTRNNTGLTVNIALNYGARSEIARAARRAAEKVQAGELEPEAITEELIAQELETAGQPDPDFLIRTSGEKRLSNFLLYQLAYAEFYFTPVLWPDFGEEQYAEALRTYEERDRRYGGVKA